MRAHTPQQQNDMSRSGRTSIGAGNRASLSSSLPRAQSRISIMRAANTQPSFDFMTGAETTARPPSRPPSREAHRMSVSRIPSAPFGRDRTSVEPDSNQENHRRELDELKAEIKTLRYTIDSHKQEEELTRLRHESEVREARRKGEEDFKKMQAAEAERSRAVRQYEALSKEMAQVKDTATNERAALEKRLRELDESKREIQEELEDIKTEREESVRILERKAGELETRNKTLQQTLEELQQDSDQKEEALQKAQKELADKDAAYGNLEGEVLKLKAQAGDVDTLEIIKRELSEQVTHIRRLEATNREQAAQLKHYTAIHKSVEVVEEEKRSLQVRLEAKEGLENELEEARIQRQRLEDERLAWTAYLQSQEGADGQVEFDSPEAVARALVEERLQNATLVEKLGGLEPELTEKDSIIQNLEAEKAKLAEQMQQLKSTASEGSDSKAKLRLERQRALAIKEVEYLRAQLKAFDTEDTMFQPENVDQAKIDRVQELEDIVDKYRQEIQTLHNELASAESSKPAQETTGSKRSHEESAESEQLGQLLRKNRKLQDELSKLQTSTKVLQKELSVSQERLKVATTESKTRILSLRSNPTSDYEAIKLSTLNALRKENADLLAQLQNGGGRSSKIDSVPLSTLEASQRDVADAEEALRSEKKRNDRLKKVWLAKSQEFRELVVSLLGWDVVFMPNGKMRVTSYFYPSKGDDENSIVFDGEKGTMKVSGGPQSAFAKKIMSQIRFWVNERGSIPCFLAALTLEFYEEARGDGTLRVEV
ncbi:spindle assembly checkpoint component Mad1 [Xylogone sp. PMI_703]|nr:spindle assembly checkpoint component Mad1 [Xylogone sp. PMI_703]